MNKKLITLAVAAAMVAPLAAAAETTLYGRIDTAVVNVDVKTPQNTASPYWSSANSKGDAWDIDTGTTRMGVKGSEDLGNGLKAIFQAEWQFTSSEGQGSTYNPGFTNRLAYAGLSGGFGTVTIGRQWTPYYGAVDKSDVFNTPGNAGTGPNIVSANKAYLGPTRMGNQLTYVTPDFSGFKGKLALVMDRATYTANDKVDSNGLADSDGVDAYIPAVTYDNGPISLGLAYIGWNNDIDNSDIWGISGSYNFGMFKVIAQYEDADDKNISNTGAEDAWSLTGEAFLGNNTIRALYGQRDADKFDTMDVWALSAQHNFSKRTRVYAEYIVNDADDDGDLQEFNIGFRHDF